MQVQILGCGEAFDERLSNTSLLVRAGESILLLDCGYSAPPSVWRAVPDSNAIDLIYLSHAHADHYFGLPALLGRMWEEKRTRPLVVMSQAPVLAAARNLLELGYAGLAKRFEYEIEWLAVKPAEVTGWRDLRFQFAPTVHSTTNLAVRIEHTGLAIVYSGDGKTTEESRSLCRGVHLVIHEAFSFEESPVHADIPDLLRMAASQQVKHLALVHLQRDIRRHAGTASDLAARQGDLRVSIPEPGDVLSV